jgi:hypothetical protein
MTDHPITPPPELVRQWTYESNDSDRIIPQVAAFAAQWGADQELEACCEWQKYHLHSGPHLNKQLRAARRPKPPTLKEQAIKDLDDLEVNLKDFGMGFVPITNLRKALEALPDD